MTVKEKPNVQPSKQLLTFVRRKPESRHSIWQDYANNFHKLSDYDLTQGVIRCVSPLHPDCFVSSLKYPMLKFPDNLTNETDDQE